MTDEQCADMANGIWLCRNHHKMVDDDEGAYPISMIEDWKTQHEARIDEEKKTGSRARSTPESDLRIIDGLGIRKTPDGDYEEAAYCPNCKDLVLSVDKEKKQRTCTSCGYVADVWTKKGLRERIQRLKAQDAQKTFGTASKRSPPGSVPSDQYDQREKGDFYSVWTPNLTVKLFVQMLEAIDSKVAVAISEHECSVNQDSSETLAKVLITGSLESLFLHLFILARLENEGLDVATLISEGEGLEERFDSELAAILKPYEATETITDDIRNSARENVQKQDWYPRFWVSYKVCDYLETVDSVGNYSAQLEDKDAPKSWREFSTQDLQASLRERIVNAVSVIEENADAHSLWDEKGIAWLRREPWLKECVDVNVRLDADTYHGIFANLWVNVREIFQAKRNCGPDDPESEDWPEPLSPPMLQADSLAKVDDKTRPTDDIIRAAVELRQLFLAYGKVLEAIYERRFSWPGKDNPTWKRGVYFRKSETPAIIDLLERSKIPCRVENGIVTAHPLSKEHVAIQSEEKGVYFVNVLLFEFQDCLFREMESCWKILATPIQDIDSEINSWWIASIYEPVDFNTPIDKDQETALQSDNIGAEIRKRRDALKIVIEQREAELARGVEGGGTSKGQSPSLDATQRRLSIADTSFSFQSEIRDVDRAEDAEKVLDSNAAAFTKYEIAENCDFIGPLASKHGLKVDCLTQLKNAQYKKPEMQRQLAEQTSAVVQQLKWRLEKSQVDSPGTSGELEERLLQKEEKEGKKELLRSAFHRVALFIIILFISWLIVTACALRWGGEQSPYENILKALSLYGYCSAGEFAFLLLFLGKKRIIAIKEWCEGDKKAPRLLEQDDSV